MDDPKLAAALYDGIELTHEEYVEQAAEMGLEPEDSYTLTPESTIELGNAFEEMLFGMEGAKSFNELREMHQKLEPKHARSPKRYAQHKKAVERRRKRKNGGKK